MFNPPSHLDGDHAKADTGESNWESSCKTFALLTFYTAGANLNQIEMF